jgi:hypothetical protein
VAPGGNVGSDGKEGLQKAARIFSTCYKTSKSKESGAFAFFSSRTRTLWERHVRFRFHPARDAGRKNP